MFTFKEIEKYTDGTIVNGDKNQLIEIYSVSNTKFNKDEFYIPIIFKGNDNEKNILQSVESGSIGFMINNNSKNYNSIISSALKYNPNLCILSVDDVNMALYNLGLKARQLNLSKEVIAITGSYGKTTLSSLISTILEIEKKVLHDFHNDNNNTRWHVSILLQYFEHYDIAVLECGTSNFGRIEQLSKLVKPSVAIINSIASSHIYNFKTKENILKEKMHIVDYLKDKKLLYLNADDDYLDNIKESDNYQLEKYSVNEAWNIKTGKSGISFTTKIYKKNINFHLNLYGYHHIRNIVLAIKIAELYNIKEENIIKGINSFRPVDGRLKILNNKDNNITLVDDVYNSCYESVTYGLDVVNIMKSSRKIAVLGTIGSGPNGKEDTSKVHEKVGRYFSNLNYDYLYLYGDYTKHIYKGALNSFVEKNIKKFKTKEALIIDLKKNIKDGDLLYIKDAGLQNFEEIVVELKNYFKLD